MSRITTGLLFTVLAAVAPPEAFALITGGEGNTPITDPGWPRGAAAIFNHPGRIAWWEGPPEDRADQLHRGRAMNRAGLDAEVGAPKRPPRPSRARWYILAGLLAPFTALTYLAVSSARRAISGTGR